MPSFVFQHTPVPEEYELLRKAKFWELPIAFRGYGAHSDTLYVKKKGCLGYHGEGPCSPDVNSGQFESWKKVGGVLAAFFGHDHLNDFSGFVDGIMLAQHKTAGFRAYTDGCKSCVRCVTLDEKDLSTFTHELKRFKQFGLKCESLGPVIRTLSDRQSLILHIIGISFPHNHVLQVHNVLARRTRRHQQQHRHTADEDQIFFHCLIRMFYVLILSNKRCKTHLVCKITYKFFVRRRKAHFF
jgi:hypothetical protein